MVKLRNNQDLDRETWFYNLVKKGFLKENKRRAFSRRTIMTRGKKKKRVAELRKKNTFQQTLRDVCGRAMVRGRAMALPDYDAKHYGIPPPVSKGK